MRLSVVGIWEISGTTLASHTELYNMICRVVLFTVCFKESFMAQDNILRVRQESYIFFLSYGLGIQITYRHTSKVRRCHYNILFQILLLQYKQEKSV